MTKKTLLLLTALALAVTSLFVACSGGSGGSQAGVMSYTVTFDKNNTDTDSTDASPKTKTVVEPATTIDALPGEPTREGWIFTGWNTKSDGTGDDFEANTPVTASITVYAQWEERVAGGKLVTYDKNTDDEGSTDANPKEKQVVPPETTVGSLPTPPTRPGYDFVGWFTVSTETGGLEFSEDTTVTADITVYARWTVAVVRYTVTFDKNNETPGSTEADPQTKTVVAPDTTIGGFPTPPTREGYLFTKWNTEPDGSGDDFTADTEVTGNITVYAQWEQRIAGAKLVTFNKNNTDDGSTEASPMQKQVAPGDTTVDALPEEPTRPGFIFAGWYTVSAATGGTEFTATTPVTDDIPVYARWRTPYTYIVTFSSNGGNAYTETKTVIEPATTIDALPATEPTKSGSVFVEWNTKADGTGDAFTTSTVVTETTTVYAKWRAAYSHTVTFNSNGGDTEADPAAIDVVEPATTVGTLPATVPTKSGNIFDGWYTAASGGTEFTATTPVTGDITVFAKWEAAFTVTFSKNNTDTAGTTEANPPTKPARSGGTIDALPEPPTRSEGWGAGMVFDGWYTDTACTAGNEFTTDTVVSADTPVYAKWKFVAGTAQVVGQELVHNAPALTTNQGDGATQGNWAGTGVNADGSVTYTGGAVRYKFPDNISDYDFFTISYVSTGMSADNITKQWNNGTNYTPRGKTDPYPSLSASGTLEFEIIGAGTTGGVAIQTNSSASKTIKFTKVTFTKGVRHTITFNSDGAGSIPSMIVTEGIVVNLPVPSKDGYNFKGWKAGSGDAIFNSSTINADLALTAQWEEKTASATTFTVDFSTANVTGFNNVTASVYNGGTGYEFTYGSSGYDGCGAKFTITLPAGIYLSDYVKVTADVTALGGDTNSKPFALNAGVSPTTFTGNLSNSGALNVTSGDNVSWSHNDTNTAHTMTFTIANASSLTGTLDFCIYAHCGNSSGTTKWRINNVIFSVTP